MESVSYSIESSVVFEKVFVVFSNPSIMFLVILYDVKNPPLNPRGVFPKGILPPKFKLLNCC